MADQSILLLLEEVRGKTRRLLDSVSEEDRAGLRRDCRTRFSGTPGMPICYSSG